MDVTCERCGTEYEFDETLLSGRGTSVKCTNCGHVFKVYPRAQAEADRATSSWRLRLKDGTVDTIDSLRELQRRIGSGELTPENEIARGEEGWKTLGSIPELETFFQAAGVQLPSPEVRASAPSSAPPPSTSKDSSLPPGRRPRQPTLLGVMPVDKVLVGAGGSAPESAAEPLGEGEPYQSPYASDSMASTPSAGTPSASTSAAASPSATSPSATSTPAAAAVEDAEFHEPARSASRSSARTSTPPPGYFEDDDDIPDLPGVGWSPLRWLLVIAVVGGLILLGAQWERVARLLGIGSDPALIAAGITEGDGSLAEGYPEAYASAIEAYGRSMQAGGDRDPEIVARLSRANAMAAQAQLDDGTGGESVDSLSAAALMTAQSAVALDPRDLDSKIALADALRLTGDNAEARTVLEEARSMSFSRTAEFFRVDARLSGAEAGGGLENGLRSAKQAVDLAPNGVPYLLLLARAQHAAEDDADARAALQIILADAPDHPVATRLFAEFGAPEAVADAGVEGDAEVTNADAGIASETAAQTEPAAEPVEEPAPAVGMEAEAAKADATDAEAVKTSQKKVAATRLKTAKKRRAPKPAYDEYDQLAEAAGDDAFVDGRPPVRDYEWYMREGRAELAGAHYSRARAFFDSALEARPGSAEAMDGLGHVAARTEDFDSALRYFRVAAQRGHPDGYFNLGQTYQSLGRNEEAVSAYYTYVKRRPEGRHAKVARSLIKSLEPNAKLPPEPEPEAESEPQPEPDSPPEPGAEVEPSVAEEPAPASESNTP